MGRGAVARGLAVAIAIGIGGAFAATACSQSTTSVNTTGGVPGSPCGTGTTITLEDPASCRNNANLPGCFMCVRLPNDAGAPGVCAIPCRIGGNDCPAGQTCAASLTPPASGATWNGCSSYGTDVNGTVGYCN